MFRFIEGCMGFGVLASCRSDDQVITNQ